MEEISGTLKKLGESLNESPQEWHPQSVPNKQKTTNNKHNKKNGK
jgi:hypothetical protein